jgi:HD-like signal output (HDOD) protein
LHLAFKNAGRMSRTGNITIESCFESASRDPIVTTRILGSNRAQRTLNLPIKPASIRRMTRHLPGWFPRPKFQRSKNRRTAHTARATVLELAKGSVWLMTTAKPTPGLKELLSSAQLPALPQSAIRLLELSQNADNGPAEFAVPIESDPGLTGQVLKFVNSSYFGFSREISSVKLAITLVGIRTIKNFSLWSAVFSLMPNPKCGPFDLKALWQDSLRRALFARAFGKLMGLKEAEDLFAGALLQDMAIPLLAKEQPAKYLKLLESRKEGETRLSDLERAEFGWTHAEAAGFMARQWSLPEEFAQLIEAHTKLDQFLAEDCKEAGKVAVALSALLPAAHDNDWYERQKFLSAFERLSGGKRPLEEIFAQIDQEFTEFAPVLKLATPGKSLTMHLTEEAAV